MAEYPSGGIRAHRDAPTLGLGIPPIRRRAFWAVQVLVLAIAFVHTFFETVMRIDFPPPLYLIPTSLYFIPVVYAALRFGIRGSVTTALWSIALTVPNILLLHNGLDRIGILWQLATMVVVGAFVGIRVDLEHAARREVERRERDLRTSEQRYRALFDNAAEAVFVVGNGGIIADANAAASRLFEHPVRDMVGAPLNIVTGDTIGIGVLDMSRSAGPIRMHGREGVPDRWVEPVVSGALANRDGGVLWQVVLHDVTLIQERQQGLERFARRTVTAREEERRRIGRELHDGPLQALMLVGRKLDVMAAVEGTDGSFPAVEARALLDDTAGEVRRISRALRPSVLDDLGLVPALRSEAAAVARRSGIVVRFRAPDVVTAPSEVELSLLRVVQEALRNVERHAGAGHVSIRVSDSETRIRLVIRDDGTGIGQLPSAADLLSAGRLGVVGMEERTRLAGGDFVIHPARPRGTVVAVVIPKVRAT
ncbi:MAG: ATP-binding protein [Candidatus Limnocylindrales bacterium]